MIKLAAIINEDTINAINRANTDPGTVSNNLKIIILGQALPNYILPTAFFLVIAFGVYGGILYFTAYGNEEKATKGKNTITWAFVGALIIILAFVIVRYVATTLLGAPDVSNYLTP